MVAEMNRLVLIFWRVFNSTVNTICSPRLTVRVGSEAERIVTSSGAGSRGMTVGVGADDTGVTGPVRARVGTAVALGDTPVGVEVPIAALDVGVAVAVRFGAGVFVIPDGVTTQGVANGSTVCTAGAPAVPVTPSTGDLKAVAVMSTALAVGVAVGRSAAGAS